MSSDPTHSSADQGGVEADLLRRTVRGGLALGLRQGLVLAITLVGGIAIARLLSPGQYGYYAIAVVSLAAVSVVGDGGIGASLIRQPVDPTQDELDAAFSFQLAGTLVLGLVGLVTAQVLHRAASLPAEGVLTVSVAMVAPVVATLKTVPTITLERRVTFGPIGLAGVVETLLFNLVGVAGAAAGLGPVSLSLGLIVGSAGGAAVMARAHPWRPRLHLRFDELREHLRFGLPYQGMTLVSLSKDSVSPLVIGLAAGATQVGYVEWAQRFAAYAVLALFIVQRLLLTTIARLQDRPDTLARAVEVSLRSANAVVAPLALGVLVMSHPLVDAVFGSKWRAALPVFWWLWAANLFVPSSIVAFAVLNALGHSVVAFRYTVLWMVATWVGTLPLVLVIGFVGYGVTNLAVQLTNLMLFKRVSRLVPLPWLRSAVPSWLAAAAATALAYAVARATVTSDADRLVVFSAVLALAYLGALLKWSERLTGLSLPEGWPRWLG